MAASPDYRLAPENRFPAGLDDCMATAGVPCTLVTIPGMHHGADGIAPKAEAMQEFRRSMIDHLRMNL